jgi:hypothetical protein
MIKNARYNDQDSFSHPPVLTCNVTGEKMKLPLITKHVRCETRPHLRDFTYQLLVS